MLSTYLVTGANRGLGLEFVRQLAARGDRVIAGARDVAGAGELRALPVRVVELDVSSRASIERLSAGLGGEPLDVLINNAGISSTGKSLEQVGAEELERAFLVNSIGPMMVAKAAMANLRAGRRRVIVNISSQLASIANNTGGSSYGYRASKAALNMLTRSLGNELRGEGFTCVALHPGWVRTDMGGVEAPLASPESVGAMLRTIDGLNAEDTGGFLNLDGTPLPW